MNEEEYKKMYFLEEEHWWFTGKRFLVNSFLKKYCRGRGELKILDVGCGTGINAEILGRYGLVYGIDSSKEALSFCKKRGFNKVTLGSAEELPYSDNNFDLVSCLDVLYHKNVEDDEQALKEINRVLVGGGYLVITDAAMKCLWSQHDLVYHGERRYSLQEMKQKLKKSGFEIKKITYFNTFFFPVVFLTRKIKNILGLKASSDIKKLNKPFNFLLKNIYQLELSLIKYVDYPFGVSLFVLAKKIRDPGR